MQKKEVLAGRRTPRLRKVTVTLDATEAIRTGYAAISQDGDITMRLQPSSMLRKLEPILSKQEPDLLVPSCWDPPEFDHILTEAEATKFILGEMKRFDKVLAVAKRCPIVLDEDYYNSLAVLYSQYQKPCLNKKP